MNWMVRALLSICGPFAFNGLLKNGSQSSVWEVGGDGVQPGEDVEVDGRGGDQSSDRDVAFPVRVVPVRPMAYRTSTRIAAAARPR